MCHVEVDGTTHALPLRGRLFERKSHEALPVAVGDRVLVRLDDDGGAIEEVLPRDSQLTRSRHDSSRGQVLAANVSLVLVTAAVAEPPFQPELVDRILAGATRAEIDCVLVLTKIDRDKKGRAEPWIELYRSLGYQVFVTSVAEKKKTEESLEALRELLHQNISMLSGASGVGKSSLINTLCPGLDLRVGSVTRIRQGRHMTTHTQLIPLPGGGYVLDTPGIRNFGLFGVGAQEIQFLFPEIRGLVGECGYRNCTHAVEPDCAVLAAVESGAIHPQRFESYSVLMQEAEEA